jgi:hypothetical protein
MGGPAPDSVNQANKDAGEKVTVANLDVWLHELTKKVAILEENAIAKDVIIKDLNERLSKLEKGVGSGGGSTPPPLQLNHQQQDHRGRSLNLGQGLQRDLPKENKRSELDCERSAGSGGRHR